MTTPHKVLLQQALDALGHFDDVDKTDAAIAALQAAIDAPVPKTEFTFEQKMRCTPFLPEDFGVPKEYAERARCYAEARLAAPTSSLLAALKRIDDMCSAPPNFNDATIQDIARAAIAASESAPKETQ